MDNPIPEGEQQNTAVVEDGGGTVTPDPQVLPVEESSTPEDNGALERIRQESERNSQLLNALGIDPESDIADRFQAGLITKDQLVDTIAPRPQVNQQYAPQPEVQVDPATKIKQLVDRGQKEGVTQDDFLELAQTVNEVINGVNTQNQESTRQKQATECFSAVVNTINSDEMHTKAPDNIRQIEQDIFVGATDYMVGSKTGSKELNPKYYNHYSKKCMDDFNTLRNHWIEQGKSMGNPAPPPNQNIQPISSNVGSSPISPPGMKMTVDNIERNARAYLDGMTQV